MTILFCMKEKKNEIKNVGLALTINLKKNLVILYFKDIVEIRDRFLLYEMYCWNCRWSYGLIYYYCVLYNTKCLIFMSLTIYKNVKKF